MAELNYNGALAALMALLDQDVEITAIGGHDTTGAAPPVLIEGELTSSFAPGALARAGVPDTAIFLIRGTEFRIVLDPASFESAHQLPDSVVLLCTAGLEITIAPAG